MEITLLPELEAGILPLIALAICSECIFYR